MDDNLNTIITTILNVRDMGTYYASDNKNNAFTKTDADKLVRAIELMIAKDILEICNQTADRIRDIDNVSPDMLKFSSEIAINKIVNRVISKYNLKKSKAL